MATQRWLYGSRTCILLAYLLSLVAFLSAAILVVQANEDDGDVKRRNLQQAAEVDPTTLCSSVMEVSLMNTPRTEEISVTYPVATGYPNGLRRCVIFVPSQDVFVDIAVTFISTEEKFDFVEAYPLTSYNVESKTVSGVGDRLLQLSGVILPADEEGITVKGRPGQPIMIVLRTDGNRNVWTGFKALVVAKYKDCYNGMSVVNTGRSAYTFSDGFVKEYPPNYSFCWVFVPPPNEYVLLQFASFNTERGIDIVEVFGIDGPFNKDKKTFTGKRVPVYGEFSGLSLPPAVSGKTNEVLVMNFRTDETLGMSGFSGKAVSPGPLPTTAPTRAPTRTDCESGFNTFEAPMDTGVSLNDGFGSSRYPSDQVVCYVIRPFGNSTRVTLEFAQLSLDLNDRIEVYSLTGSETPTDAKGASISQRRGPNLAVFTSFTQTPISISGAAEEILVVQLRSDPRSVGADGFQAVMKSTFVITTSPTRAPTSRECSSGMTVHAAPAMGTELVLTDGYDGVYPDNFHVCFVLLALPGQRLALRFDDDIDVANDKIEIFTIKGYSVQKGNTFRGKGPILSRIHAGSDVSHDILTRSDQPIIVSFRSDFGQVAHGFTLHVSSTTPAPTPAPTPPPPCGTRMSLVRSSSKPITIHDGFRSVVPRGVQLCWVVTPMNNQAAVAVIFDQISLAPGALLEVFTITAYNTQKKTVSGLTLLETASLAGKEISTQTGQTMLISLRTPTSGWRGPGFMARGFAPCSCPMFTNRGECEAATCNCKWFVLSCGEKE